MQEQGVNEVAALFRCSYLQVLVSRIRWKKIKFHTDWGGGKSWHPQIFFHSDSFFIRITFLGCILKVLCYTNALLEVFCEPFSI